MIIKVRVTPSARKEAVLRHSETEFVVSVKEDPERGEANKRIRDILARELGVAASKVRMLAGQRSRVKRYSIG